MCAVIPWESTTTACEAALPLTEPVQPLKVWSASGVAVIVRFVPQVPDQLPEAEPPGPAVTVMSHVGSVKLACAVIP